MNSGRQAPHFGEGALTFTSLILSFFFFTLSALQVGLPGLLATREGRPTLFTLLLASLCVATHAWLRYHGRDTTSPRRVGRRI